MEIETDFSIDRQGKQIPQVSYFSCLLRKKNLIKIISKEKLHVAFIESKIKRNVERILPRTDFLGCHYRTTAVCCPLQKPVNAKKQRLCPQKGECTLVATQELSSPTFPSSLFQHSTSVVILATHSLVVSCTDVHRARYKSTCAKRWTNVSF
jgi:hypothetical protein